MDINTGKIALVTGANKGIGRAIAGQLAGLGMIVLVGARDEARGEAAAAELRAEGGDIRFVRLDVTDAASIDAAAARLDEELGRLDVLVNNAAIGLGRRPAPSEVSVADLRRVYETNVIGVAAVTNAMLPLLRRSPAARIVNLSSELGSFTVLADAEHAWHPYTSLAYGTSKAALNAITVLYADELRPAGIKVNAVSPGYVATDLNGHSGYLTPEQGAKLPVLAATLGEDGPTGAFLNAEGTAPW
jgi:NAD(P)-dependent dehydrogenase (short-subunit alcohol dehydrogenase family)